MNKLTKTAKRLDTFFKVVQILFTVLTVVAFVLVGLLGICRLVVDDPEFFTSTVETLDIGFLELELTGDYAPNQGMLLLEACVILILCGICCLLGRIEVKYIRAILAPMKQGQPFSASASINLKKMAILSIIIGILINCADLADQIFMATTYGLSDLLINQRITEVNYHFSFDLTFLLYSAVLLLLSYVFSYGTQLQELSDETL